MYVQKSINRYLVLTYVHMHIYAYMSFCSDIRVFGEISCMNLHSTVYQVFKPSSVKENIELGSYMLGLNFKMSCL